MRRTTKPAGLRRRRKANGEGFTLLELMVALLIMGIVLGAVAPAFYGVLRAGTITNYKSVANGIAVQSTEQMRSFAYYQVGFVDEPDGCPTTEPLTSKATTPVLLSSAIPAPLASLPSTQTVGHVTYNILRCVWWADSTISADTSAYKETYVKVSWSIDGGSSYVTQTSALYPGGNTPYASGSGGENDWAPSVTTTTLGTTPSAPATASASADSSSPGWVLDISWAAVSGVSCYNVWFTPSNPGSNPVSTMSDAQEDADVCGTSTAIDVNPNTNYYIQVVAIGSGGNSNPVNISPWPMNSGSTTGGSTTTTTSTTLGSGTTTTTTTTVPVTTTTTQPCGATAIVVSPAGQNSTGNQAYLDSKTNYLVANNGMFKVTVTLSGTGCSPQVAYNPTGCVPGATGCAASYLSTYTVSGNQYTFTTASQLAWTPKSWEQFIPVVNTAFSTTLSAQSYVCVENGNSGTCK